MKNVLTLKVLLRSIALLTLGITLGSAAAIFGPRLFGVATLLDSRTSAPPAKADTGKTDANAKTPRSPTTGQKEPHSESGGLIKMSMEKIAANKIALIEIGKGLIVRHIEVPGTIVADPDRVGRVAAKVIGTISELKKRVGDHVELNEIVAILESREIAEARSEYIAASVSLKLQATLLDRSRSLFQKQILAEQSFLREQNAFDQATLRTNLARQKLSALHADEDFNILDKQEISNLRRYELHSPIAGRVVDRPVSLGTPVGGEGQLKELYTIVDLSTVWVELAVGTSEIDSVKAGLAIKLSGAEKKGNGKIIFISPQLDKDTRTARVIGELNNESLVWRPGSYVTVQIGVESHNVDILVPRSSLQTISGETVVFVKTPEGLEKREVQIGRVGDDAVEIIFGLDAGEIVASTNTFLLKAELGKAEAEHAHP